MKLRRSIIAMLVIVLIGLLCPTGTIFAQEPENVVPPVIGKYESLVILDGYTHVESANIRIEVPSILQATVKAHYVVRAYKDTDACFAIPFFEYEKNEYVDDISSASQWKNAQLRLNGNSARPQIRHITVNRMSSSHIFNDYMNNSVSPDLTVTEYEIKGKFNSDDEGNIPVSIDIMLGNDTIVAFKQNRLHDHKISENVLNYRSTIYNGETTRFYVIGDEPYTITNLSDVTIRKCDSFTYEEFAMLNYDEQSGISRIDWYNAVVDLQSLFNRQGYFYMSEIDPTDSLIEYIAFEYSLKEDEQLQIDVVTPYFPLYTNGNGYYSYEYMLSRDVRDSACNLTLITPFEIETFGDFNRRDNNEYEALYLEENDPYFVIGYEEPYDYGPESNIYGIIIGILARIFGLPIIFAIVYAIYAIARRKQKSND